MQLTNLTYSGNTLKKNNNSLPANQEKVVSFKGNPAIKLLSTLESNPVLALATIDFWGMIVPRFIIDINRNKQELGHLNWDAGRETAMREVFSSSISFFAPGVIFTTLGNKLLNHKFNPLGVNTTSFTDYKTLNAIEVKANELLKGYASSGAKSVPVNEFRQKLAQSLLQDIKGAYSGIKLSDNLIKEVVDEVGNSMSRANIDKTMRSLFKEDFKNAFNTAKQQLLSNAGTTPDMKAINREAVKIANETVAKLMKTSGGSLKKGLLTKRDSAVKAFIGKFLPKAADCIKETEAVMAVKGTEPIAAGIGNLVRDTFSAADDIAMKAANGAENVSTEAMQKSVNQVIKATSKLKVAKLLVPFVTVFTLLVTFPKFSNWVTRKLNGGKDQFPGLAGLSKEDKVSFSHKTTEPAASQVNEVTVPQAAPTQPNISYQVPIPTTAPQNKNVFAEFERRMGK